MSEPVEAYEACCCHDLPVEDCPEHHKFIESQKLVSDLCSHANWNLSAAEVALEVQKLVDHGVDPEMIFEKLEDYFDSQSSESVRDIYETLLS